MTIENNGLDIMGMDEIENENTSIDDIENESVNLIFVGIDKSGSMNPYKTTMTDSLTNFKQALLDSKEVDELLLARADFSNNLIENSGYKKVEQFPTDYDAAGMTPLYDVVVEGSQKLIKYMEVLRNQGMRVKAVFSVFSDGADTSSAHSITEARKAIEELNSKEITTAFIAFGGEAQKEANDLKFKNILNIGGSADPASELRKAFNVLSKSVIESSKSVVNTTDNFWNV